MDSHKRTVAKTLSWRFIAMIVTMIVTFVGLRITGIKDDRASQFALATGAADTTVKLLIYYLHERVWNKISFGRVDKSADFEI